MQRTQAAARRFFSPGHATWRGTGVLLVVAWLVPFLVHVLPWAGVRPLGVYLLPAFWTAFVAVYLHGFRLGMAVALVVPAINFLTTELPSEGGVSPMVIELTCFAGLAAMLQHRWPMFRGTAPLAWLGARAAALAVQWAVPAFAYSRDPIQHYLASVTAAWSGLAVLLALNWVLVALQPKDGAWDAE